MKNDRTLAYRAKQSAYHKILSAPDHSKWPSYYPNRPEKKDVEKLARRLMGRK